MDKGRIPFLPHSDWVAPSELPNLSAAKEIAVDLETSDPRLKEYGPGWATGDGFICGVAVAVDGWKGYLPIAHRNGVNMDRDKILAWCRDTLSNPDQDKIFANATYDAGWLQREGVEVKGRWLDVQVAAPLLDEHAKSYSLNALGSRYMDEKKSESMMYDAGAAFGFSAKEVKGKIHVLPPQYVGEYGEQDADLTLRLWAKLKPLLVKEGLENVFDMETRLLPVVMAMRKAGVLVDLNRAFKLHVQWESEYQRREQALKKDFGGGKDINIWSAKSIYGSCERLGIKGVPRTPAGSPSFTSGWLEEAKHPMFVAIKQARKLSKGVQFLSQIVSFADHGDGRIHAQIHPLRSDDYGTVSGRFSMSSPNLQQIPTRDPDIGRPLRSLFLPEKGEQWISADYKSQETRVLMSYVVKRELGDGHALVEAHKKDTSADFHSMVAKALGLSRFQAKTINLGIIYGMGRVKLADRIGVSVEDAEDILDRYHKDFYFVKRLKNICEETVRQHGRISTMSGRVARFPLYEPRSPNRITPLPIDEALEKWPAMDLRIAYVYRALNRLIQGTAADQNKMALLSVWDKGICPKITIHDEICVSGDVEARDTVVRCMESAVEMYVPFAVESSMGNSWGDIEK